MSYSNINNPVNYQLQGFGQNGVRTISTDQLYIQGEYYRVLVAEEDSYVTAVSVLGDDLTAEFVYAGTTIYGLFTEVSVSSGSLTAYIAGPTDIEDVWAYINEYGLTNAATIEAADCAKDAIAPLLDKYYAKASLVMVPSLYKTSIVYSERPLTTSGQLAFTRSNDTATRVGPDGLIEKVRTNLILQSNSFDTSWSTSNSTITGGQADKDGGNGAWLLEATASTTTARVQQVASISGVHTTSIYAKAGSADWIAIQMWSNHFAYFDVANGVVGNMGSAIDASIEAVENGYYRCSLSYNASSVTNAWIYVIDGNGSTAVSIGANVYLQNAQLETGDIATDYIPTTTAAVTVGPVANLPRLNYPINSDGSVGCPSLLLEPQRTNLLTFSEQFNNATWSKTAAIVTANTAISPDGTQNADTLADDTGTASHLTQQSVFVGTTSIISASIYLKKNASRYAGVRLFVPNNGIDVGRFSIVVDLETGAITSTLTAGAALANLSYSVINAGNGWYRAIITGTCPIGTASLMAWTTPSGTPTNDGFATTAYSANGQSFYLWGAQFEVGAYATSYIPTLGASVTRGADLASASYTGLTTTSGSLFIDLKEGFAGQNINSVVASLGLRFSSTGTQDSVGLRDATSGTLQGVMRVGGTVSNLGAVISGTAATKVCFVWTASTVKMFKDGALFGSASISTPAVFDTTELPNSARTVSAPLAQFLIFPTPLSDTEAIAITTL